MPVVWSFDGSRISVYARDHNPPHFHIESPDGRALVVIDTLDVLKGDVRRHGDALAWAADNRPLLMAEWNRLNRKIER